MAFLKLTLVTPGDSVTEMVVNETNQVKTPGGNKVASTIQVGDFVCLHPDGSHPVAVASIEEVV